MYTLPFMYLSKMDHFKDDASFLSASQLCLALIDLIKFDQNTLLVV